MMWSDLRKRETCQATRFFWFFYEGHLSQVALSIFLTTFTSKSGFQIKTILVVSGDFLSFNWSFKYSCLSGWIYFLSFFFAHQWSKVDGFRCAVTRDCSWNVFAVLLTETETWQLVCVSLWEHTNVFCDSVYKKTQRQFCFPYFSVAKKFVIYFLHSILWQLWRWDL